MLKPKPVRWVLTTVLAAGALTACADGASAPTAVSAKAPLATKMTFTSDTSGYFTLDPSKRVTVVFKDHKLTIPANAVCDPSSTYGADQWDQPCAPATQPITMQVVWGTTEDGHTGVRFSPDLRFIPTASTDPQDWVLMTLREAQPLDGNSYSILWQDPSTGSWVDEGAADSTLRAYDDVGNNKVTRRLKHFSGYVVGLGFTGGIGDSSDLGLVISLY